MYAAGNRGTSAPAPVLAGAVDQGGRVLCGARLPLPPGAACTGRLACRVAVHAWASGALASLLRRVPPGGPAFRFALLPTLCPSLRRAARSLSTRRTTL